MPTTRLMQFSSTGGSEEAIDENGLVRTQVLHGVSSSHFLRLIEDRGQIGFWTLEFSSNHMTTSVGLYRLFGIAPSIPLGREDVVKMMHPDDRPAHRQIYETIRAGYSIEREFRIIRPDGTMRWLQSKAEAIVDATGAPARAVGVMIDVTDQHAARQSSEDGWHRYKTLVTTMAVIEYRISAGGDFSCVCGWYELTGQTQDEASDFGWLNVIHPDDRELTRSAWLSAFENGGSYAVDPRVRCKDGQYRRFLSRAAPVFNPDGTIREWIGALLEMSGERAELDHSKNSMPRLRAHHIRAARALLDWTIDDLALKAGVSVSSVRRLEADTGQAVGRQVCQSVRQALQANGIFFTSGTQAEDVSIHFRPR